MYVQHLFITNGKFLVLGRPVLELSKKDSSKSLILTKKLFLGFSLKHD